MIRLTAYVRPRDIGSAGSAHPERVIEVSAASYEAAKEAVLEQLPADWIVASFRVDRNPETAS